MALIDKETIRKEIERLKYNAELGKNEAEGTSLLTYNIHLASEVTCLKLLSFLDSLPEQPVLPGIDEEGIHELRESEDERIRKWIASYIHCGVFNEEEHPMALKAIEYLEKQKDKVSFVDNDTPKSLAEEFREADSTQKQDYSGLSDLERAIHRGFLCAGVENVPVGIINETAKECLAQMKLADAWDD